jgi:purine nucleosidase/pyrimidine-specific ribonucleoside hydrolase
VTAQAGPVRVVVDCDPGRDDALAILALLGAPNAQVDFITTVAGNVSLDRAAANALRVLAVAGVDGVPVYAGAYAPLARALTPGSALHGDMADGEPPLPEPTQALAGDALAPLRAWCARRGSTRKRLVAIGPLTNIARLLVEDARALDGVDELYVMGGTLGRLATRVSPTAEFNFHSDPEAADIVLRSGAQVHLYDYDATTACQLDVAGIDAIESAIGPPVGRYVGGWLRHLWEYANRVYGRAGVAVHDMYAALGATGVEPGRWEWHRLAVDCSDELRGTLHAQPCAAGSGVAVARDLEPAVMARELIAAARNLPANQGR